METKPFEASGGDSREMEGTSRLPGEPVTALKGKIDVAKAGDARYSRRMRHRFVRTGSLALAVMLGCLVSARAPLAAPPAKSTDKEKKDFTTRFAALAKANAPILVKMRPQDPIEPPVALAQGSGSASGSSSGSGSILVAQERSGFFTPPLLAPNDIQSVIQQNMVDIRRCYKKQLHERPDWGEEIILDIAIRKTGRVSEVSLAPRRVRKATLGQCLMRAVPKWRFPEFTGETDDGTVQEVMNTSLPFSFSKER